MNPAKCPVCEGRTTVPAGFYTPGLRNSEGRETCRSCGGKGVLLSESSSTPTTDADDPTDLTYRR